MRLHLVEAEGDGSPVHGLVLGVAYTIWEKGFGENEIGDIYAAQNLVRSWSDVLGLRTADEVAGYIGRTGMAGTVNEIYESHRIKMERWKELEALQL